MMKIAGILLTGLALLGCEMMVDNAQPTYQPVQPPVPTPVVEKTPAAYKLHPRVCTPLCKDMVDAAQMSTSRKSEKMLREFAAADNLSAHEQVHLTDIALAALSVSDAGDIMKVQAHNPALTKEAHRHLKIMSDKLLREDEKDLLKALQQNPGK